MKRERRTRKIKRIRLTPHTKLLKQADAVFSKWIRSRDGWTCVICGSTDNPQNGHFVPRGRKSVRFDVVNCNCQCRDCNGYHRYDPGPYTKALYRKWPKEAIDQMLVRAEVKLTKIPRSQLDEIILKYGI